jgi:hypothetical protein
MWVNLRKIGVLVLVSLATSSATYAEEHCESSPDFMIDNHCADSAVFTIDNAHDAQPPGEAAYPHDRLKNRYISFDPNKNGNDGKSIAFRVELKSLEQGSCDGNGAQCRVDHGDEDCRVCSTEGNACITATVDCTPSTQTCDPSGENCVNDQAGSVGMTWWVGAESPLGNGVHLLVSESFRRVSASWPAVVHVGDCEVVPQATYGVRAVNVDSGIVSDELLVSTAERPGANYCADCVGPLADYGTGDWAPCPNGDADCQPGESCVEQWAPPDGATNFDDITATVFLFQSVPGLTIPEVMWVDLHGNDSGTPGSEMFDPPNYVANFADISAIVLAFQGRPYPFLDPADCPDVDAWP